eukprot:3592453-Rhodomonas_salina.1
MAPAEWAVQKVSSTNAPFEIVGPVSNPGGWWQTYPAPESCSERRSRLIRAANRSGEVTSPCLTPRLRRHWAV